MCLSQFRSDVFFSQCLTSTSFYVMFKPVSSARYTVFLSESANLFPFIAVMLTLNAATSFSYFYTHTHQAASTNQCREGKMRKTAQSQAE